MSESLDETGDGLEEAGLLQRRIAQRLRSRQRQVGKQPAQVRQTAHQTRPSSGVEAAQGRPESGQDRRVGEPPSNR
jgi:hypothetical protein